MPTRGEKHLRLDSNIWGLWWCRNVMVVDDFQKYNVVFGDDLMLRWTQSKARREKLTRLCTNVILS